MNKFAKVPKFEIDNDNEYKIEANQDSVVYTKKTGGHLLGLYYLVTWKSYLKEKNTWEPFSIVMQLRMIVSTFHKDHPKKPTVTLVPLDSAPPMAKPTI